MSFASPSDSVITCLAENEIFVFGSNTSGMHGKGAAKMAYVKYGAKSGQGFGHFGQSFAIPTKGSRAKKTLALSSIQKYIDEFMSYAVAHPKLEFHVTQIGCGLAGLRPENVAPLFSKARGVANVHLPCEFLAVLNAQTR